MPLFSVHSALHTVFGASLSVVMATSDFSAAADWMDITNPVMGIIAIGLVAVVAELIRYKAESAQPQTLPWIIALVTIISLFAFRIDALQITDRNEIFIQPNAGTFLMCVILTIWVLSLQIIGIMERHLKS